MPYKVILDVDTGTDDAVALMCAALHPDLQLIAATTVNGNVQVEYCTENTLRVFDHIGVQLPVYEGMSKPLVRDDFPEPNRRSTSIHGRYLDIPASHSTKQDQPAVDFLLDTYRVPSDTILIPVGPLTNIAAALQRDPGIAKNIPALILMGGGHEVGNTTPSAEFNIWADPEAARVVFASGIPKITVVPLDATHRALVSSDDCARLRSLNTPAATAAAIFVERRIEGYRVTYGEHANAAPVHDALAVLAVVDPSVLQNVVHVFVDVETKGELTVGRTVLDTHNRLHQPPNAYVALDADQARFVELLIATLGRTV
ncbi:MAG TPA: nucleoside hydrolase [Aggregatilineaceae bacterium]|nr:nucleoside hydrolase [Aggregatilineaceae bacterium]